MRTPELASSPISLPSKPVPGIIFVAPGLALIGSTWSLERAREIDDAGVLDAFGLADETGCTTSPAPRASCGKIEMTQTTQSIPAKARTCRLSTRFICRSTALRLAALEDAAIDPIRRHR